MEEIWDFSIFPTSVFGGQSSVIYWFFETIPQEFGYINTKINREIFTPSCGCEGPCGPWFRVGLSPPCFWPGFKRACKIPPAPPCCCCCCWFHCWKNKTIYTSDEPEPSWLEPQLELKDFQLGSARDLFPFSSKSKIGRKRAEILILIYFLI